MKVIMFQPRFAPLVASGVKPYTIRKPRKNPIKVGDKLSLRTWTGKPYRSKQKILRDTVCVNVEPFKMDTHFIWQLGSDDLAKRDGFADAGDMVRWFKDTHGLPFEGVLIEWKVTPPQL